MRRIGSVLLVTAATALAAPAPATGPVAPAQSAAAFQSPQRGGENLSLFAFAERFQGFLGVKPMALAPAGFFPSASALHHEH